MNVPTTRTIDLAIDSDAPSRAQRKIGVIFGLIAALIWGGYVAITHRGMRSGLTAMDLTFLRFAVSAALLLPWLVRHEPLRLAGIGWFRGIVLALLAGPLFVFIGASGFHFAPLAHGAVIQLGMVSLMGIVLSAIVARESLSIKRIVGVAVIIAGLTVTAGPGIYHGGAGTWKGDLLFAVAGSMWALFTVLQRRWQIDAFAATAVVSVLSGVLYVPVYFILGDWHTLFGMDPRELAMLGLILGVVAGVVALFAFSRTIQYLGPGRASLFPALAPALALLIGIPLSGEIPNTLQVLGLALLFIGLMIPL